MTTRLPDIAALALLVAGAGAPPPVAAEVPGLSPAPRTAPHVVERARWLMGAPCRIAAAHRSRGEAAALVEAAFGEIARWEGILSDWDEGSELSRLNRSARGGRFSCSEDLFAWLDHALALAAATEGAFDPTVGPLADLHDLRGKGRRPAHGDLERTLRSVGHARVELDRAGRAVRFLADGVRLDPGASGKGFALDAAARLLRQGGAEWALIDFGGQIVAVGAGPEGCGFPVAVASGPDEPAAFEDLLLRDASVSTSANDERGLVVDGAAIGHILDPRTGGPAEKAVRVTVVAPSAALADALSTALFVMGADEGLAAAERFGVEARFVARAGGGRTTIVTKTPGYERLHGAPCGGKAPLSPASGARRTPAGDGIR